MATTQYTKLDRADVAQLRAETLTALEVFAAERGLNVSINGGRYDPATGTYAPKVEFSLPDAAQNGWNAKCSLVGLKPEDFGATFKASGKTFKITGLNLRASKFPVEVHCVEDGKGYKFPEARVQAALGRVA